jgi:hypothetical protein
VPAPRLHISFTDLVAGVNDRTVFGDGVVIGEGLERTVGVTVEVGVNIGVGVGVGSVIIRETLMVTEFPTEGVSTTRSVYAAVLEDRPFVWTENTNVELVPIAVLPAVALIESQDCIGELAVQENVPAPLFVMVSD